MLYYQYRNTLLYESLFKMLPHLLDFIINDLNSVLILTSGDQILNVSLFCSYKYN